MDIGVSSWMGPLVLLLWAPVETRRAVSGQTREWLSPLPRGKRRAQLSAERNGCGNTDLFYLFLHPFTNRLRGHGCLLLKVL